MNDDAKPRLLDCRDHQLRESIIFVTPASNKYTQHNAERKYSVQSFNNWREHYCTGSDFQLKCGVLLLSQTLKIKNTISHANQCLTRYLVI